MEKIQSKAKGERTSKRQRNSQGEIPPAKRRSLRLKALNNPISTTKITDLNDDCLQQIFKLLHCRCLFNIALASEWLRPAANAEYKRTQGSKRVDITECHDVSQTDSVLSVYSQAIILNGLKMTLQFLRCFGSSIPDLSIVYEKSDSKRYQYVHHYIQKYCAGNLKKLRFCENSDTEIKCFDKPMVRVEAIDFVCWSDNFDRQLPLFNQCFPNLRRLNIYGVSINHRYAALTFQHLEHLHICIDNRDSFTMNNAIKLLNSNRQLQSLHMNVTINKQIQVDQLLDMIEEHALIFNLIIEINESSNFPNGEYIPIRLPILTQLAKEHSTLRTLEFRRCYLTMQYIIALLCQHKSLQKIRVYVKETSDFTQIDEIKRHGWNVITEVPWFGKPGYVQLTLTKK